MLRSKISHTLPLKKLNKVKPLKWGKCDYVPPSSPIPECYSIPPSVSRCVKRSVRRRVNRSPPSPVNLCISSSVTSSDLQDDASSKTFYNFFIVF